MNGRRGGGERDSSSAGLKRALRQRGRAEKLNGSGEPVAGCVFRRCPWTGAGSAAAVPEGL